MVSGDRVIDEDGSQSNWIVPLKYIASDGVKGKFWLQNNESNFILDKFKSPSTKPNWIKFNDDYFGFYVVNYDFEMWNNLIMAINDEINQFSPLNRANLIKDAFKLASIFELDFEIFFNLIGYLTGETHVMPWLTVLDMIKVCLFSVAFTCLKNSYIKLINCNHLEFEALFCIKPLKI